ALLAAGLGAAGALAESAPPARIGRYRVLGVLGEGGMGTVYEAEQDTPRRRVALKVIRRGMTSPSVLRRFEHEAQVLGRLNHPGIAQVYEAGVEESSGAPRRYLAIELVEGRTLTEATHGLGLSAKLELLACVCDAIHHAHESGVLHRDLKPSNVLVDRAGRPKVLDFGVARLLDEDERATAQLTATGSVIGTLAYMSPEQIAGAGEPLDARADVYSLGVIAYELLSGRLPHDVRDAPLPAAARAICEREPVPLGDVERALRGDLQTIVGCALAKDRERRYASAAALAADVRRFLRDEPIVARPASTLYQLRKFARRNRAFVVGVSIAALALLVGTGTSTWLAHQRLLQRERADAKTREAQREAYRANVLAAGMALERDNPRNARALLSTLEADPAAWEYQRLRRQSEQWIAATDPGVGFVWFVAFRPQDASVVAVGSSGAVAIWDPLTGARVADLPPAPERSKPRALSADGALCATIAGGSPVVWDTRTGAVRHAPRAAEPLRVSDRNVGAFSADGRWLALCDETRGAFVFELGSDAPPREFRAEGAASGEVAFSGDGRVLATTQSEAPAAWDVESGALLRRFPAFDDVRCVAADRAGRRLAVGNGVNIHLLDVENGGTIRAFVRHADFVTSVQFSPDDLAVAAALEDGSVWIWDCASGAVRSKGWVGRPSWKTSLAWSADGARILTGIHASRMVRLWDARGAGEPEILRGHTSFVYPVVYTPDGLRLVSGGWDRAVRVWSAATGRPLAALRGHSSWINDLAASPDSTRVASVGPDGLLNVWNLATGACVARKKLETPLRSVAWSPDGAQIAVGAEAGDHAITLLDAVSLAVRCTLTGHTRAVNCVAFDPRGARLASVGDDGSARLWDVEARACVATRSTTQLYRAAWSRDGSQLALAGAGGFLELVDPESLRTLRALAEHPREVFSAAFSPDAERLYSGGRDGNLCVWDLGSGALVGQFAGHRDYVKSVVVAPDGTRVATGSGDFTVRQWESEPVRATTERFERAERLRAQAQPLVEHLFATLPDADAVVAAIRADPASTAESRAAALEWVLERASGAQASAPTLRAPR
ncbi:MAG: hypothetical protein EPO68_15650, partial [Planctomycetota bacterium]